MTLELPSGEYEIRREGPSQHELLRALEVLHDNGTPRLVKFGVNHKPAPNDISGGFGLDLRVQIFGLVQCGSLQSKEEINVWRILGLLLPGKSCVGHTKDVTEPRLVTIYYQAEPRSGHLYVYPTADNVPLNFSWTYRGGHQSEGLLSWPKPVAELVYKPRFFALRRSLGSKWICVSKARYLEAEQKHGGIEPFANGEPCMRGFDEDRGLGKRGYTGKVFTSEDELVKFASKVGFERVTPPEPVEFAIVQGEFEKRWFTNVTDREYMLYQTRHTSDGCPWPHSFYVADDRMGKVFYDQVDFEAFLKTKQKTPIAV